MVPGLPLNCGFHRAIADLHGVYYVDVIACSRIYSDGVKAGAKLGIPH